MSVMGMAVMALTRRIGRGHSSHRADVGMWLLCPDILTPGKLAQMGIFGE